MAAATALTVAAASSAYSLYSASKTPKTPAITPLPTVPTATQDAQDAATQSNAVAATKRKQLAALGGRSSTLLTGPQGISAPANTQRSTLLGQ